MLVLRLETQDSNSHGLQDPCAYAVFGAPSFGLPVASKSVLGLTYVGAHSWWTELNESHIPPIPTVEGCGVWTG